MENQNINSSTPSPVVPVIHPEKWHHHKGAVAVVVLVAIVVGLVAYQHFLSKSTTKLGPTLESCASKEAQKAINDKNLNAVRSCEVKDIQVDNKPAKLVSIVYGAGMDCPSGCIYSGYVGFLLNGKLVDFQGEPEIYPIFTQTYGDWCNVQNRDLDIPSVTKAITSNGKEYYWTYRFNNFDNQARIKSLLQTSTIMQSKDNPQYCILNGEITITKISSNYANQIDFSKLNVKFQPISGAANKSTEELVKECDNKIVDGYKVDRWQCIEGVATGKQDPLICNQMSPQASGFIGTCMRSVAVFSRNPKVCEIITDYLQKDQCYENVAAVMKDASVCNSINDPSEKNYCLQNSKK